MFILGGLISVAFGVVLFARPGVGAVTLAMLFGLFSLIYGVSQIALGIEAASHREDPALGPGPGGLTWHEATAEPRQAPSNGPAGP